MARYIQGDTILLTASFTDWNGEAQDLTDVAVRIYDLAGNLIDGPLAAPDVERAGLGSYICKYTLPARSGLVYEFSGLDAEGKVQLDRKRINPIFAD